MNAPKTKTQRAYHFVGDKLRDGRAIPKNGVWLKHTGPVEICASGLHASIQAFDALQYAPGPNLCLVDCRDIVHKQDDKIVCRERRIVSRIDATEMMRYFARMQALSVIDLWDTEPPIVVLDYLMTGDESIRAAAIAAARDAAWAAASATARAAARDAAWAAASAAASATAWAAARKNFNDLVNECFWESL